MLADLARLHSFERMRRVSGSSGGGGGGVGSDKQNKERQRLGSLLLRDGSDFEEGWGAVDGSLELERGEWVRFEGETM